MFGVLAAQLRGSGQLVAVLVVGGEVLGQAGEVGDVPAPAAACSPDPGEPLGAELANGVEQPVPRLVLLRAQHDRLVHQADQGLDDVIAAQGAPRAGFLGGRDAERAGEDRQPGPQQPLGGRAQVVAPLGRRAEGLLVRQGGPAPAGEHQEAVL